MRYALCLSCLGLTFLPANVSAQGNTVPDTPKGFEKQYSRVVKAYRNGNEQALKAELGGFSLPEHWFTRVFGPEKAPELAKLYCGQFKEFEVSLHFAEQLTGQRFHTNLMIVETELEEHVDLERAPKAPPATLEPLPPIQRFQTHMSFFVNGKIYSGPSWMDSFIYWDGRFRFLGSGAYPFWNGPILIKQVEPVYPEEAKQQRVQGTVSARLTIARDGSVKEVEIIEGEPMLVEAAKRAMVQWRYLTFMKCGQPEEMRMIEHVNFTLR